MSKRQYKRYSKEFKLESIRLADKSGKQMTQVARELGLRVSQIYKWRKQLEGKQDGIISGKGTATDVVNVWSLMVSAVNAKAN